MSRVPDDELERAGDALIGPKLNGHVQRAYTLADYDVDALTLKHASLGESFERLASERRKHMQNVEDYLRKLVHELDIDPTRITCTTKTECGSDPERPSVKFVSTVCVLPLSITVTVTL